MQEQDIKDGVDTVGCKVAEGLEETLCNYCGQAVEAMYLCTVRTMEDTVHLN